MLSIENADLVKRDTSIPGLATLLDPEAFVTAIQAHLPDINIQTSQIVKIRYRPTRNCLVEYRLEVDGSTFKIYTKAFGTDASTKLRKALELKCVMGPLRFGHILLEDIDVIVTEFPNDIELKTLKHLGKANIQRKLLCRLFPDRPDLWNGTFETIKYTSECNYVARLKTSEGLIQAILKFYRPKRFQTGSINSSVFQTREKLRVPKCLGSSESHGVVAFEWLPGRKLKDIIRSKTELAIREVEDTGFALAELHNQEVSGLIHHGRDSEAATIYAQADMLSFLWPPLARRVKLLAKKLVKWITDMPPVYLPIHGDFNASQMLMTDGKVGIVDFDGAIYGNPMADLGRFIAYVERIVICDRLNANQAALLTGALINGYERFSKKPITANLKTYTAYVLFQIAHNHFKNYEQNWPKKIEVALDRVEALYQNAN